MVTSWDDQPRESGAESEPDTLLLRVLGAVEDDDHAAAPDGPLLPVWETDGILPLEPGTIPPSTVLARLRVPVAPL